MQVTLAKRNENATSRSRMTRPWCRTPAARCSSSWPTGSGSRPGSRRGDGPDPRAPLGPRPGPGAARPGGDARRRRRLPGRSGALRDQADLLRRVASDATAWRVIDAIDQERLEAIRAARARARAARLGGRRAPGRDRARHRLHPGHGPLGQGGGRPHLQARLRLSPDALLPGRRGPGRACCAPATPAPTPPPTTSRCWSTRSISCPRRCARTPRHPDPGAGRLGRLHARLPRCGRRDGVLLLGRHARIDESVRRGDPRPARVRLARRRSARMARSARGPGWPSSDGARPLRLAGRIARDLPPRAPPPRAPSSPSPITRATASRCCSPTRRATPVALEARHRARARVEDAIRAAKDTGPREPALSRLRRQRRLAGAGARRPGPHRLGQALLLDGRPRPRRAQAAALPAAARRRADHPLGPADPAAPARRAGPGPADLVAAFSRLRALPAPG